MRSAEEKETHNFGRQAGYEVNYKFMMATKLL